MSFDPPFLDRLRAHYVHDEACKEATQIETSIESIGTSNQAVLAVRAVLERVERACQGCLQIAQHGVDPLELRQVAQLEVAYYRGQVNATRIGHCGETPQAVAGHAGTGHQAGLGPFGDGLGHEAADQIELDVQRMAVAVHRDGSHKRHLVLGVSPGLAIRALTAEVSIVQLHGAIQAVGVVLLGHGAVDSLMQQPCRGVADAQLALERQRRQPGLGLADEVDAQEPDRQRQFGVLHQTADRQ